MDAAEGTESRRRGSNKKVLKKIEEKGRCRSALPLYRLSSYLRRITPSPIRPEARSKLAGTRSEIPPVSGSGVVVVVLGVISSTPSAEVVGAYWVGVVVVGAVFVGGV